MERAQLRCCINKVLAATHTKVKSWCSRCCWTLLVVLDVLPGVSNQNGWLNGQYVIEQYFIKSRYNKMSKMLQERVIYTRRVGTRMR